MLGGMRALALLCLALVAAPASAAERRYSVTDFDRIEVDGPYVVRLTTGRASAAVATGPQGGLDRLTVEVSGQTLRIRRNRSGWTGDARCTVSRMGSGSVNCTGGSSGSRTAD